jgi:hypothetical protein
MSQCLLIPIINIITSKFYCYIIISIWHVWLDISLVGETRHWRIFMTSSLIMYGNMKADFGRISCKHYLTWPHGLWDILFYKAIKSHTSIILSMILEQLNIFIFFGRILSQSYIEHVYLLVCDHLPSMNTVLMWKLLLCYMRRCPTSPPHTAFISSQLFYMAWYVACVVCGVATHI